MRKLQARRRYRRMAKALAELDKLDERQGLGAPPACPPAAPPPRKRRFRLDATAGVALTVVAVFLVLSALRPAPELDETLPPVAPVLPADVSASRILPAVDPGTTGAHAFLAKRPDGTPVGFDPCRPIHYVVNPAGMPDGGLQIVRDAVAEIEKATGLAFTEDGVTSEPLTESREPLQPQRYGDRWAPVLVGWATESQYPPLSGDVAGIAGPIPYEPSGPASEYYVSGQVGLDSDWFAEAVTQPEGDAAARGVVMHELGHVVGLDHVDEGWEVMNGSSDAVEFGPGDREGLAAVGAGGCRR
ncbi:peptidase [Actinomycetes bacterium KLBMP 9759]